MDWKSIFDAGLEYDEFLGKFGTESQQSKWDFSLSAAVLNSEQETLLSGFVREINVICMAGAWCGDCVEHCPIFHKISQSIPNMNLRFVDRDQIEELNNRLRVCGAARVPQSVLMSEEFEPVAFLGDRPLSKYRQMVDMVTGESCSSGIISPDDPLRKSVIQDWVNEYERAHAILRTSPKLRQKHQD